MKKWWKVLLFTILYIASVTCQSIPTYAAESTAPEEESPLGFNYKVIQPENQRRTEVGFFDLTMTPGQNQTVQIELINRSSKEITINVDLSGVKTNGNGVLEYGPTAIDNDKSLKYDFADIVKGPESVTVPGNGTAMLELNIQMPQVQFDGFISGGIQLKAATDKEKRKKQSGIINEYAFVIGMLLSETDTVVNPELELNKVFVGLNNFRNTVYVNFSNVEAAYLNDLTMEVQIMKKGSNAVLYETKKSGMRVGPNNMVEFPVSMNGEKMEPGDYQSHIVATAGDRSWEWSQDFKITDEEADKFNQQDVDLNQEQGFNWLVVGLIFGAGLIISIIIFFVVRMTRKNNNQKKNKGKKKRAKKTNDR